MAHDCSAYQRGLPSRGIRADRGLAPLIPPRFRDWLHELLAAAELVTITGRITACRDSKDDKFLELAVNGHADLIVSGDADLLTVNPFRGIPIVAPATFVQGWREKSRLWPSHDP